MSWEDVFAKIDKDKKEENKEPQERQKTELEDEEKKKNPLTKEDLKKASEFKVAKDRLKKILNKNASENISEELRGLGDPLDIARLTKKGIVTEKDLENLEKIIKKSGE